MLENAADFLKECRTETVIVYDTDGDGIGAAVILAKTFKRVLKKYPKTIPREHDASMITDSLLKRISKFGNIIFLDIAADEKWESIVKLAKKSKILIIDHHQIQKNLNVYRNIIHLNPILFEKKINPSQYTASKIVYDICSRITDVEDLDWLAGLGIVNDSSQVAWKSFMKKIYRRYKISPEDFEKVNNIITSVYMFSKNKDIELSYKACIEADSPSEIINGKNTTSKELLKFYDIVEKEVRSTMKSWKNEAEIFDDKKLIILELKTKFSINSVISTKISFEKPHYTVLVAGKGGKHISISLRRQDGKVNCGLLAKKLTNNLKNSSGGGHIPAAGIKIMSKDWMTLKKRLQHLL